MRRWGVIAFAVIGVMVIVLAIALASVGTELDQVRLNREDLQFEVDSAQRDAESLTEEKTRLQHQTEEQLKTIEQLKAELERTRAKAQESSGSAQAPVQAPVAEPAPAPAATP